MLECKILCGCQIIAKERKRNYIPYTPDEEEGNENE